MPAPFEILHGRRAGPTEKIGHRVARAMKIELIRLLLVLSCAALGALHGTAVAADAASGKAKAQTCTVCHGPIGMSAQPDAPNLAGQPEIYLGAQLRAFRDGKRRQEVMTLMAKSLSDDDIDNLAAWYSSIRVEARAPN